MKILVTGATGFVGTWLTKKLLDLGHEVRILARSGRTEFPFPIGSNLEVTQGDVSDLSSLDGAFKDVHSVFHLAGLIGYSKAMRTQMVQANVVGTANVVEMCQKYYCKRLVYMSSVVAVGASFDGQAPLNENSPFNLHHLDLGYFETKLRAEQIVKKATTDGLIDAVILNPSTIYGPGDAKKGSRSTQIKVARGEFPFYTAGGVSVIHIDDVIEALCAAWTKGRTGERYILCGENLTQKQLFQIIADEAGISPPKIYLPKPIVLGLGVLGDALEKRGKKAPMNSEKAWAAVLYHWFDNTKAKNELGLSPRPAKNAIRDSVQWMKKEGVV